MAIAGCASWGARRLGGFGLRLLASVVVAAFALAQVSAVWSKDSAESAAPALEAPKATDASSPAAKAPGPVSGRLESLWNVIASFNGLMVGAFGAAIGAFAKWLLEQISARVAYRRKFAEDVTKRIAELADKHYWALANYAGVVAGQLEGFLRERNYYLLLQWRRRADLQGRLDAIAEKHAADAFPQFCRLIGLFDAFQFQESNTYLLTRHFAGETSKRLYNMFIGSLPDTLPLADLSQKEVQLQEGGKVCYKRAYKLASADFGSDILEQLKPAPQIFEKWLKRDVAEVAVAASALRAYSELLNHELALLYRDWFDRRDSSGRPFAAQVAFEDWPNVVTGEAFRAIEQAGSQSVLLRPLGSAGTSRKPRAPQPKEEKRGRRDGGQLAGQREKDRYDAPSGKAKR